MNLLRTNLFLFFLISALISCNSRSQNDNSSEIELEALELTKSIPIGSNSWVINNLTQDNSVVSDSGIHNWTSLDDVIHTYIKTGAGKLNIGFKIKSPETSKIKVTVGNVSKEITISNSNYKTEEIGSFTVPEGYNYIKIQGLEKSGNYIADINEILFGGSAISSGITFVPTSNFYFGRRGPSVHLNYELPEEKDVLWFYNEITVIEGEDVLGSYFMANGFGEGYFGIQVNSETERRILFSVWSPFDTQNPDDIPEDQKIVLLKKGEGVTTGEFGNEGSGGQSYKIFDWKTDTTYRFLLKGEPSDNNSTDFTAYFYSPENEKWNLIASFRRPKTNTYLKRPHSFLENFLTGTGHISRKALYTNQWISDTEGIWHELTKAQFTADATARKGSRLDYAGGAQGNAFFMQNCGFFNENTQIDSFHERTANGTPPTIDFSALE